MKDFSQHRSNHEQNRVMAMQARIVLLFSFFWFSCSLPIAQELPTKKSMNSDKQEQILEEITVMGQKELYSLKMEVIRAEDLKFEIFNSLNSTDDFDITCEMLAPINSHIKRRYCNVGFIKKAQAEEARKALDYAFRVAGASGGGANAGGIPQPEGAVGIKPYFVRNPTGPCGYQPTGIITRMSL